MNVLIVDDEPEWLSALKSYFQNRGDSILTATNGQQALQAFHQSAVSIDVVLTDQKMPIMNGMEFIRSLRDSGSTVPVIMMSGDWDINDDPAIAAEVYSLLPKPLRMVQLDQIFTQLSAEQSAQALLSPTDNQNQNQSQNAISPTEVNTTPDNYKILVVDDEPHIRMLLCEILATEHYQTEQASDGVDALEKWQQAEASSTPFDLLVVDLKMPRMDGTTLLGKIRQSNQMVPLIVLTGHADLNDSYDLLAAHQIADFLTKPITQTARLMFAVKSALEKSQLQMAFKTLNQELEQRVILRTEELAEQTARAEEANLAKSEFLSCVSHELHTPLNAIIGFSEIIKLKLQRDAEQQEKLGSSVQQVIDAGWYLTRLVDDILDISRADGDQLHLVLAHCDLNAVIKDTLTVIEQQAKLLSIQLRLPADAMPVTADPVRLKQVLVHLLSNAIKFSNQGDTVQLQVSPHGSNQVAITVSDTGVGIAAEDITKIFEPFTRLKYATTNAIEGVGAGLLLAKLLTEQMNGSISVESEVDQGSVFSVVLPGG